MAEEAPLLLGLDLVDRQAGKLGAMARGALVAALGLELDDADLLAALVALDGRGDRGLAQAVLLEHRVTVAREQERLELDGRALVLVQPVDEQGLALLDAVLQIGRASCRERV